MNKSELHICALNPEAHEPRPECKVGEVRAGEIEAGLAEVIVDNLAEPPESEGG